MYLRRLKKQVVIINHRMIHYRMSYVFFFFISYHSFTTHMKYQQTYFFLFILTYNNLLPMAETQQPLRILAIGDSLTAGYYNYGQNYHPYAIHLKKLFESANIPVNIEQKGISGERVLRTMIHRLQDFLNTDKVYDWIIILGGTNDIGDRRPGDKIFKEGLEQMYGLCLNHSPKTKIVIMTVIEISFYQPTDSNDKNRQQLNSMIRDYAAKTDDQQRVCLVDLDKGIPYHSVTNNEERNKIWDDGVHLTPAGYNHMATMIFNAIKSKL